MSGAVHGKSRRSCLPLRVSPSPGIEAADTLVTLNHALNPHETPSASAGKLSPLKLVLFKLQRHVREEQFTTEFMAKGGLGSLVELLAIDSSEVSGFDTVKGEFGTSAPGLAGNSLAYALLGLSAILDLPYRITWDLLGSAFLKRVSAFCVARSALTPCRSSRLSRGPPTTTSFDPPPMFLASYFARTICLIRHPRGRLRHFTRSGRFSPQKRIYWMWSSAA